MAGYCKDCNYWRKSTFEPNNAQIGVCGMVVCCLKRRK